MFRRPSAMKLPLDCVVLEGTPNEYVAHGHQRGVLNDHGIGIGARLYQIRRLAGEPLPILHVKQTDVVRFELDERLTAVTNRRGADRRGDVPKAAFRDAVTP